MQRVEATDRLIRDLREPFQPNRGDPIKVRGNTNDLAGNNAQDQARLMRQMEISTEQLASAGLPIRISDGWRPPYA